MVEFFASHPINVYGNIYVGGQVGQIVSDDRLGEALQIIEEQHKALADALRDALSHDVPGELKELVSLLADVSKPGRKRSPGVLERIRDLAQTVMTVKEAYAAAAPAISDMYRVIKPWLASLGYPLP